MSKVQFKQVDVFTAEPYRGNPVAVVMDSTGLTDQQMQQIASWTNLSETTFVLPATNPQADYRVRIFTPLSELPFAGHPTIGTAWALLEDGKCVTRSGRLVQECHAGLIPLRVNTADGATQIAFELPEPKVIPLEPAQVEQLQRCVNCDIDRTVVPVIVDVGPRWVVARLKDSEAVLATQPDFWAMRENNSDTNVTGVCLFGMRPDQGIEVRSFAPACGVNEDPVCGSGNGSVAAFIRYHALCPSENGIILSSQGQMLGRNGKLELTISEDTILVGGQAVTCISGDLVVPSPAVLMPADAS